MSKIPTVPAAFSEEPRPQIALFPVTSNQVAAIGYDGASKTLAVKFTRGTGAIYHYPNVEPQTHADFVAATSIGTFFGKHIKHLPFTKYQADPPPADQASDTAAPAA
jgi:hypothetical protein